MKQYIGLFFAFLSVSPVYAATEIQDKQKALEIMKQYAQTVSCMNSFEQKPETGKPTTINDVYTVKYSAEESTFDFYVLWSGDMGCSVGSGSMSTYITEVARYGGEWKPYTVQTDYAFGENVGINYRFIDSIKKINSDKFEVIAWNHADEKYGGKDGGQNFPANKFKYTLERERFEPWRITNQTLIEQNK